MQMPWRADFNALVYVLAGHGAVGPERRPIGEGQLAVMGEGNLVTIFGDPTLESRSPTLEMLLLGGAPIRERIAWHGPFVMNTNEEIFQAIQDYHAGRMGRIPAKRSSD